MVQFITKKKFRQYFSTFILLVYCPRFSLMFGFNNQRNTQKESSLTDIFCIMFDSFSISINSFLQSGIILDQKCTQLLDPALDDMLFLKVCFIKNNLNMLWIQRQLTISKITPGGYCFFANYCCLHSFFEKKLQNDIISLNFALQVICFTASIKGKV